MKTFDSSACSHISSNKIPVISSQEETGIIIQKLLADNEQKAQVIEQKDCTIKKLQTRIESLETYLRLEKHRHYGRSSEKSDNQDDLFNEIEVDADSEQETLPSECEESPRQKPAKKGRKPLSSDLPRHPVYLSLSEEEKQGATSTFFVKVKEELDVIPAQVRVLEYFQEKAVFSDQGEEQQVTSSMVCAPLPAHPISGAIASITLLAHIIVSKYCDALPLYRLEGIMSRYGGSVTRTTMANWLMRLSVQLQPLINLMREEQLAGDIINADETSVQVIKEPTKAITSDKYMWVTLGGKPGKASVLFDYHPSRSGEVAMRLLEGFRGYLQTDGYVGYHAIGQREEVTALGCWDHARRKFAEAEKAAPRPKKNAPAKVSKATMALSYIRKLYQVEADIRALTTHEKYRARQLRTVPVLKTFKQWLEKHGSQMDKGGLTYKAMAYTLKQWDKLVVYCTDGRLAISNVAAENAIRPFVVGRKNWLFADTPRGARASAIYYSLIESAKLHGLDPFKYFVQILQKLPAAETVEDLEQLLPWACKPG